MMSKSRSEMETQLCLTCTWDFFLLEYGKITDIEAAFETSLIDSIGRGAQ